MATAQSVFPGLALARAEFHISAACVSCHADPHDGIFGKACTNCHSQTGWGGRNLKFRHERDTGIALEGAHADLPCTTCHDVNHEARPGWFKAEAPPQPPCKNCHADPHAYQFSAGCGTCHSQTTFASRGLKFSHERNSTFKINALHAGLPCSSCHKPLEGIVVYKPLPDKCSGCHTAVADAMAGKVKLVSAGESAATQPAPAAAENAVPSPHAGRVKCTDCHATDQRTTSAAQHAARCAGCHNARYRDLYFDWSRSLADRLAKAQAVAAKLQKADPDKAAAMAAKIAAARKVGMHNIRLARSMLDEVISAGGS